MRITLSLNGQNNIEIAGRVRPAKRRLIEKLWETNPSALLSYFRSHTGVRCYGDDRRSIRELRSMISAEGGDPLETRKPGEFLRKLNELYDPRRPKAPAAVALGDWLGVEIECIIPRNLNGLVQFCDCGNDDCDCIPNATEARDALIDLFKENRIKNVHVKTDSSIYVDNSDETGVEITVLFRRDSRDTLKTVCKLLSKVGARVNRSCGLHVHLDCRDVIGTNEVRRRVNRLTNSLNLLIRMVPHSRRYNSYCRIGKSPAPVYGRHSYNDRYYAINTTALKKFGTIEVRLHSGTTNYEKINNWIDLLLLISRAKKLNKNRISNIDELTDAVNVPERLIEYIEKRIDLFRGAPISFDESDTEQTEQAA